MYNISIYVGGLYKFDEFKELVEDLGGLVLKRDRFTINRGEYFITEEIHVLTIMPVEEKEEIFLMAKKIKGNMENPKISAEDKKKILSCLPLHDILSKSGKWLSRDTVKNKRVCPCQSPICGENEDYCFIDYLEEVIDGMVAMEMLEERETTQGKEYRVKM